MAKKSGRSLKKTKRPTPPKNLPKKPPRGKGWWSHEITWVGNTQDHPSNPGDRTRLG